jgi:hypothetical protein
MELTNENYFEYKTTEQGVPVLSSSFLKNATPIRAGNVERIEAAYQGVINRVESTEMRFGSLVHSFAEDRDRFVFEPEWVMSDTIRTIADKLFDLLLDTGVTPTESIRAHQRAFNTICEEVSWGQSWKEETRITKFIDAAQLYWLFRLTSNGKIIVTGSDVEKMIGVIKGIEAAGLRVPLLDDREASGVETHREFAIKFNLSGYPCKALLDNMNIDHNNKIVTVSDLKTTSWPIENFVNGYRYAPDENGIVQKVSTQGDYIKYMYYFQEYFYKEAVMQWLADQALEGYDVKFQYGVVETSDPYLCEMIKPNNQWMAVARHEFTEAMKNIQVWMDRYKYFEF